MYWQEINEEMQFDHFVRKTWSNSLSFFLNIENSFIHYIVCMPFKNLSMPHLLPICSSFFLFLTPISTIINENLGIFFHLMKSICAWTTLIELNKMCRKITQSIFDKVNVWNTTTAAQSLQFIFYARYFFVGQFVNYIINLFEKEIFDR